MGGAFNKEDCNFTNNERFVFTSKINDIFDILINIIM